MKRIALLAGIVVVLVVLAVAAVPIFVSADLIKQRLTENIALVTGRQVVLKGAPVLTVYPALAITISDLTIANPEGMGGDPFLTSESVTARVKLLPLLLGNAQLDSIELTKPHVHLVATADGHSNFVLAAPASPPARSDAGAVPGGKPGAVSPAKPAAPTTGATPTAAAAAAAPPRRIKLSAGTLTYDDVAAGRHEELSDIDFDASWSGAGTPLIATGTARWRGEQVDFNGQLGDPLAAVTGGPSPLRLALGARPVRLSFTGTVGPAIDGTISLTTPALRRLIEWAGRPMGNGSTFGAASLQGKIDWLGREMSFADAKLELDGNAAVGAFTVDYTGARPLVAGTLAAGRLDLSPYLDGLRGDGAGGALLSPTVLPLMDAFDTDLRLSSDEVLVGPLRFGKTAGSVEIKGGNVTLSIAEAGLYGGTLTADARLTRFGDRLVAEAKTKLSAVDARPALTDLVGIQSLQGTATGSLDIRAEGASWGEFVQRLTAQGTYSVANGTLVGLDINDLTSLADAPAVPLAPGVGSIAFGKLAGSVTLDAGILETKDTVINGNTYRIDVNGWGSLATGLVDASATLGPATGAAGGGKVVPIAISGTWRRPLFDFDRGRNPAAPPVAPRG